MNPYVYSRSRRNLRASSQEQATSGVSSLLNVAKSAFTSAISPMVAFAMIVFAAGSVGGMSLVAYSEIGNGSEPAIVHSLAYTGRGLVLGDNTTVARVGQLVYNPNSNPYGSAIFLVGPSGLYGFTGTDVFTSWGYTLSQVVPENAGEVILPVVGTVPLKISGCDTAIKQILVNCGNSSALITLPATGSGSTPRSGQLINKNGTVYLVGQTGLYGFPDRQTFFSWSYDFSQIVPANSSELALSQIGLVPFKISTCTNPLDQITGACGGGVSAVSPAAATTSIRVGQLINNNNTVYLVGQNGLYRFTSDRVSFDSWGFTGAQIVLANPAEQALTQIGLVPTKVVGCTNPLDQIARTCGSNAVSPAPSPAPTPSPAPSPSPSPTPTPTPSPSPATSPNTLNIASAVINNGYLYVVGNFPSAGTYYVYVNGQGFPATVQNNTINTQIGSVTGNAATVNVLNTNYGVSNTVNATILSNVATQAVTFTANGQQSIVVNKGDTVNYAWNFANTASVSSYFTVDKPDTCGDTSTSTHYPWSVNTSSGTSSGKIQDCQAGVTYTLVVAPAGYSPVTAVVRVNP